MARGVVVSVNRGGIEQILHGEGPGGHVHRYVRQKGREVERLAKANAPVRTGRLRSSIRVLGIEDSARVVRLEVGFTNVLYGIYQELGTGIYAGRGFIRPKRAKAMLLRGLSRLAGPTRSGRLRPRSGRLVFAKKVRGTPAGHFLTNALATVAAADPRLRLRFLRRR